MFPGGNLDPFHDGDVPKEGSAEVHCDGDAYRLAAVRETFEETGILLARKKDGAKGLLEIEREEVAEARGRVHRSEVKFTDWLDSKGGIPDTSKFLVFTLTLIPMSTGTNEGARKSHAIHQMDHPKQPPQTLHHANVPLLSPYFQLSHTFILPSPNS